MAGKRFSVLGERFAPEGRRLEVIHVGLTREEAEAAIDPEAPGDLRCIHHLLRKGDPMTHLHHYTRRSLDPDARPEAIAYCGHAEDARWDGTAPSMATKPGGSDCPACRMAWQIAAEDLRRELELEVAP